MKRINGIGIATSGNEIIVSSQAPKTFGRTQVYSFSNMAAAAAGATAGRKFSPDSILEMRVSQNLSKLGGGKGP